MQLHVPHHHPIPFSPWLHSSNLFNDSCKLHRDDPGGVVGVTHHADINLLPTMLGEVWLKF